VAGGLILVLVAAGVVNHHLAHEGFPDGNRRIFAPWFRGRIDYTAGTMQIFGEVKDSPLPGKPFTIVPSALVELGYLSAVGEGGGGVSMLLASDAPAMPMFLPRGKVSISRRFGFFILER
jgi:hypothetical protein